MQKGSGSAGKYLERKYSVSSMTRANLTPAEMGLYPRRSQNRQLLKRADVVWPGIKYCLFTYADGCPSRSPRSYEEEGTHFTSNWDLSLAALAFPTLLSVSSARLKKRLPKRVEGRCRTWWRRQIILCLGKRGSPGSTLGVRLYRPSGLRLPRVSLEPPGTLRRSWSHTRKRYTRPKREATRNVSPEQGQIL